ncbi:hypothetical protein NCCP1664_23340 [Zafaria cholistanensis]|uniref:Metallopeptidase family protein n=1 Tax=Zafaria cholistanensis TaxID=1682741 RepID=A0A5A7NSZ1_9MICC|nr:metallopeptidase family protein [Zafaria cholistanensis]GER23839.1 hypothetical protein NCCP1664_23340 [Zafaria cholistanensis]
MSHHLFIDLDPTSPDGTQGEGRVRSFAERRRNRHGRGLRGPLMLPQLPGSRTRYERFEDLVLESAERLEDLWGEKISRIEFMVELVPGKKALERAAAAGQRVPLGRAVTASPRRAASITVYRRPVEELAGNPVDLPEVVHDVVVELAAELLAMAPEDVDPDYGRGHRDH